MYIGIRFAGGFTTSQETGVIAIHNELPSSNNSNENVNILCFGERFSSIKEHPYLAYVHGVITTGLATKLTFSLSTVSPTLSYGILSDFPTETEERADVKSKIREVGVYVYDSYFCAGAIVSPSWIVTGGNCVNDYSVDNLTVLAGSEYLNSFSGTFYSVKSTVIHPNYAEFSYDSQYACVEINGAFGWTDKIKPISLPDHSAPADSILTVVGWTSGFERVKTETRAEPNSFLQEGQMAWLSKDVCSAKFLTSNITWTNTMGCAYNKTNTIFCGTGWYYPFTKDGFLYGQFLEELYPNGLKHKKSNLYSIVSDIASVKAWISNITGAP